MFYLNYVFKIYWVKMKVKNIEELEYNWLKFKKGVRNLRYFFLKL